jgi:hypothetical protein
MTRLQRVLFELASDYQGYPYFVTGNALYTALCRRVATRVARQLRVSHGVFIPGTHGTFPRGHSQAGQYRRYLGKNLHPVETYSDLFLYRDSAQRWLYPGLARDAFNTHTPHAHGDREAYSPRHIVGRTPDRRASKHTTTWQVHCFLQADDADILPLASETLDGLAVGGARNYGLGRLNLVETDVVALETVDYGRLKAADEYTIELLTPYVLDSEFPGAESQSRPWWWGDPVVPGQGTAGHSLRRRETRLADDGELHTVRTVDHGQLIAYTGERPLETARNGLCRVGTHSKLGFGEFRLWPGCGDRVAARPDVDRDPGGVQP